MPLNISKKFRVSYFKKNPLLWQRFFKHRQARDFSLRDKQGFTLIETLVVIFITSLVFVAASWAIITFYRANGFIMHQASAIQSATKGVETMVREIREASYADTGAYPIVSASDMEFVFYSDTDRDNNIERVRYFLDGSDFSRGEIESSGNPLRYEASDEVVSVLSVYSRNDAGDPIFSYFDSSGTEIPDLSDITNITFVRVNLIVNVVEGRAPNEFNLRSTAQIRNLKTNL